MASRRSTRSTRFSQPSASQPVFESENSLNQTLPNRKKKQRKALSQTFREPSPDQEEDSEYTQSSQSKKLSEQEEIQLASNVIRYLLVMNKNKYAIPRTNLVKHVFNNSVKHTRQVMGRVKTILPKVFGITLIDTDNSKYILVNELENNIPHLSFAPQEKSRKVLLFLILTHIFMSEDGTCKEDSLWEFLRKLQILNRTDDPHPYFENVKQLVTVEFVKQQYLKMNKEPNSDPTKYEFQWGLRADYELSPRTVLEFMSKVYDNRDMESWPLQYKLMRDHEKQRK